MARRRQLPAHNESSAEPLEQSVPETIDPAYVSAISDLYRRVSRAAELGRGIRLEPSDLDLLVLCGGYEALSKAAAEALQELAKQRIRNRAQEALNRRKIR